MIPDTELKIAYEQEKRDIVTFGFMQQQRSPQGAFFASNWSWVILGVLAVYLGYRYIWLAVGVEYGVLIAFACYALYMLSFRIKPLYGLLFWPQLKHSKMAIQGPVTVVLNSESIKVLAADSEQLFTWCSFDACIASKQYLILYASNGGNGIIFPKRAFLLEQEAYDFVTYIRHNLEKNNKTT